MTGANVHYMSSDSAFTPQHESQKQSTTAPFNSDKVLAQDTIYIRYPVAHPNRSIERRKVFQTLQNKYYNQILYGCTNPRCETPTCLSRQKRAAKGPFRPFTLLSARSLAAHLASQDDPEKGLCPHQKLVAGEHGARVLQDHKNQRKTRGFEVKSSGALGVDEALYTLEADSRKASANRSRNNEEIKPPRRISGPTNMDEDLNSKNISEQGGPNQHELVKKDPKSFAQALFDTAAMKLLQVAKIPEAYLQWPHLNLDHHKIHAEVSENTDLRDETPSSDGCQTGARGSTLESITPATGTNSARPVNLIHGSFASEKKSTAAVLNDDICSGVQPSNTDLKDVKYPNGPDQQQDTAATQSKNMTGASSAKAQPSKVSTWNSLLGFTSKPLRVSQSKASILAKFSDPRCTAYSQTLSHFSFANVFAMVDTVVTQHSELHDDHRLLQSFGRTEGPLHLSSFQSGEECRKYENRLSYCTQSITYVLSDAEALLRSFWKVKSSEGVKVASCEKFSVMIQMFRMLRSVDPHPCNIFPSLWITAGKLYLPGIGRFHKSSTGKGLDSTQVASAAGLENGCLHRAMDICHIVKIIFAALAASVPVCGRDIWLIVRKLRAHGRTAPPLVGGETLHEHRITTELLTILDAFEDGAALSLMTRLSRAIATRSHVGKSYFGHLVKLGEDNLDFFGAIINYIMTEHSRGVRVDSDAQAILNQERLDKSRDPRLIENADASLLLIVEWLRAVILNEWDGTANVAKCSAMGGALELLVVIFKSKELTVEPDVFYTPFLAERLDAMEMPAEWASTDVDNDSVHLLSYPFLFPPSVLISYFRAVNYAAMYRAFEGSAEAERVAYKMKNAYTPGTDWTNRLQDRLKVAESAYLVLEIRREHILVDALNQIWRRQKRELMKPLKVRMGLEEGEEGIDHGGVQQEFFRLAVAEALHPDYGAFTTDPQTNISWFHPASLEPPYKFELLGLLTSLAIFNGLTLPFTFPRALYMKLLDLPVRKLEDIEDGWPELAQGLAILRDWPRDDVEDIFVRPYVFSVDVFGTTTDLDMDRANKLHIHSKECQKENMNGNSDLTGLAPDLASQCTQNVCYETLRKMLSAPEPAQASNASASEPIMVTNGNRGEYIADYICFLANISVQSSFTAFRRGFYRCLNAKSLRLFTPDQLKALVEGLPTIDMDGLQSATRYEGGYHPTHPTVTMFWKVVRSWPQDKVRQLLEFVTASDRLPIGGVERLIFVVQKNGTGDGRLPTSHTCFGRLLLPEYESEEKLSKGLERAVENSKGFGNI